ncbi:phospholipase A [Piscinibacter sp.]|uniref:phospholipase A n=1 Tax=Piscinibacter sp. TaxID=1903157 RepID=UPI0039E27E46
MRLALLTSCALLLAPSWVGAQTTQDSAADCVAMAEPAARLACYDRLHGRGEAALLPVAPAPAAAASAAAPSASLSDDDTTLGTRWDLDGQRGALFAPRAYKPVYLLPATWTDRINRAPESPSPRNQVGDPMVLKAVEAKYQISLKAKFAHSLAGTPLSLWGGYTQSSRWQVYNGADSRPFRETNYEPELMVVAPLKLELPGWTLRMASLSLNHQSNGRALPLSRSWNRVIGGVAAERDDWIAELRAWRRVREDADDDDNPDIADHVGRAELRLARYWGTHALALQVRHSLRGGGRSRGSAQLDYVFPLAGALHGQLQIFSGYGESLIDYNLRQTKAGLGVTIAGWR